MSKEPIIQEQRDLEPLWTVQQTAKYLSVSPVTIYHWISKKRVFDHKRLVMFSHRVRIPRSEVQRIAGITRGRLEK